MTKRGTDIRSIAIKPELYDGARQAALHLGAQRGRTVSLSEWIREAMREKLVRENGWRHDEIDG